MTCRQSLSTMVSYQALIAYSPHGAPAYLRGAPPPSCFDDDVPSGHLVGIVCHFTFSIFPAFANSCLLGDTHHETTSIQDVALFANTEHLISSLGRAPLIDYTNSTHSNYIRDLLTTIVIGPGTESISCTGMATICNI